MYIVVDRRNTEVVEAALHKRDLHTKDGVVVNTRDFAELEEKLVIQLYQKLTGNDKRRRKVTPAVLAKLRQELQTKVPVTTPIAGEEGPVAHARQIFDRMAGKPSKEVLAACEEAGINPSTAKTQYYAWRREHN